MNVHLNSRNVIPKRATLTLDLYAADAIALNATNKALRATSTQASERGSIAIDVEQPVYFPLERIAGNRIVGVRQRAERLNLSSTDMTGGVVYHAAYPARAAPFASIFMRCKDGIGRNEIQGALTDHRKPKATTSTSHPNIGRQTTRDP